MDSIRNFRSLGGIKTHYGTTRHRLFRGGPLDAITPEDQIQFHQTYNVNQILDLRSAEERKDHPNQRIHGVQNIPLQLMVEKAENSADPKDMMNRLKNHDFKGFMIPMYQSFITSSFTRSQHRKLIELIITNNNSTYFHCSAGKDRTGYTSALILKLLGADMDTIMNKYLLTNKQPKKDIEALIEATRTRNKNIHLSDEDLYAITTVSPDYLLASFNEINHVYGDFDTYIQNGLKLERTMIESLRKSLLE